MKITLKWLKSQKACDEAIEKFKNQKETDFLKLMSLLIKKNKLDWANWLIVRKMKYKQYVSYAVFAAEQVIDIFEKKYPNDKRPRKAIEAAKKCIKNPSKKNKIAAHAAAYAADEAVTYAATYAAYAADYAAAYAAAYAAHAAAEAAAYAAAHAAAYAADEAATYAAAYAAAYAEGVRKKINIRILKYGIKLIKLELKPTDLIKE